MSIGDGGDSESQGAKDDQREEKTMQCVCLCVYMNVTVNVKV